MLVGVSTEIGNAKTSPTTMEFQIGKPSLNQISFLDQVLQNNYKINEVFDWTDGWSKLENMSYAQYQEINRGIANNHRSKIYKILLTLNFKPYENKNTSNQA